MKLMKHLLQRSHYPQEQGTVPRLFIIPIFHHITDNDEGIPGIGSRNWISSQLDLELVLALHVDKVNLKILDDLPIHVQFNAISGGIPLYEVDACKIFARYIETLMTRYYDEGIWYLRMVAERVKH